MQSSWILYLAKLSTKGSLLSSSVIEYYLVILNITFIWGGEVSPDFILFITRYIIDCLKTMFLPNLVSITFVVWKICAWKQLEDDATTTF